MRNTLSIPTTTCGIALLLTLAACAPDRPGDIDSDAAGDATNANALQAPAETPRVAEERRAPAPAPVVCATCGVVSAITAVRQEGQGTGIGAVAGAVLGGVVGNQVGGGSGRKIATAAGAIGGAVLGNKIEKDRNSSQYYEVTIDMEGGGKEFITVPDASSISVGSRVTVQNGNIALR
jgi:outer membrane lipoprotein SlyB